MSTVPFVSSTDTLDGNFRATAQSPTPGETIQTRLIEAPRPWYIACWTKRMRLFIGGSSVLLMRYMVCTFLAGFFPVYAENKLGLTALGTAFVIAAYPIGMSITSFIAPSLIRRMGTRNATLIGLCATIFFTMLLGAGPFHDELQRRPDRSLCDHLLAQWLVRRVRRDGEHHHDWRQV